MKKQLVYDVEIGTGEILSACIIEYDQAGEVQRKIGLSPEEVDTQLESNKWENPSPSWVGKGIQRSTHDERKR